MFIQTEATPNPVTLKFIPGKPVLSGGTAEYRSRSEADGSPLARRLFEIDGVSGVFLGSDFISVTKNDAEWQHLKPMVLGAIMEHYISGAEAADAANDEGLENFDPAELGGRRNHQRTARNACSPGRRPGRRRHHVRRLPRRRCLSAHARRLLGLPQLHGDIAPRH